MSSVKFDKAEVRFAFDQAADLYNEHAILQQSVAWEVFDRSRKHFPESSRILDIGCGTGYIAALAEREQVQWNLSQLDISPQMCGKARSYSPVVCADAERLPIARESLDGVVSSLVMQWLDNGIACFSEVFDALKPGGRFILSTLGPYTLVELREAFAAVDEYSRVSDFVPREVVEMWAENIGFKQVKSESLISKTVYPDVASLQDTLRGIGASNKLTDRRKSFTPKATFAHMEQAYREQYGSSNGVPASWEIIYITGVKP